MAKISVSSWSLHRHIGNDITLLDFPKIAREKFGMDAIELVNFQFESTERDYVDTLRKRVEENGQKVVHIAAGHGNISQRDESQRLEDVKVLFGWLDLAVHFGAPAIRIDTGQQEGELDLSITIAPAGNVTRCDILSSELDAVSLEQQLVALIKGIDFGNKPGVPVVTTKLPVEFLPR